MIFAHDTEESLVSAAWLVNCETLNIEDLAAFWTQFGYSGRFDGDEAELHEVQRLRPQLRELLLAERDEAVALVNHHLDRARAVPRLVRHDHLDWHIHAVADDRPLAERILVETAMAMIDLIRADDLSRLSICHDPTCDGVVVDLSRNRSRKYCTATCGNRVAVAAYRHRQKEF